ncbi:Uncharacterised protein [Mycobacterium tuberculosis]|nr:Uncharacterised protein [Mycobacterium tuberculosis]COY74108.1 Uncharacterised protein [Mycobacterium tuberculosis]
MVCQHPDVSPAGAPDVFQAFDVFDELVSAETVLLAVVLDREHDVLPSHVEEILWMPVDAEQGDLSGRPWKAGVYQQEPQPRLLRRLRTWVDEIQRLV